MRSIFYLKKTSKENFAKVLDYCCKRNSYIEIENGFCRLGLVPPVLPASVQAVPPATGGSLGQFDWSRLNIYCSVFHGEVGESYIPDLFTFELLQVSEDLKVIAECNQDPAVDYFQWLLQAIKSEYRDKVEELPVTTDEQAEPQADSGAVGEPQIRDDKTEQVFISHATEDKQFAHHLADDLQRLGLQVWIAPESIRPGEGWVEAIERGLAESSHMVVVLTPAALESEWVRKETDVAIAQERKGLIQVIPLDVELCEVPLLLSSYQMVSFRCDYDAGLSQLVDTLRARNAI